VYKGHPIYLRRTFILEMRHMLKDSLILKRPCTDPEKTKRSWNKYVSRNQVGLLTLLTSVDGLMCGMVDIGRCVGRHEGVTYVIKLMKGKTLKKHSLHEKTAASVLLKLFISSNE